MCGWLKIEGRSDSSCSSRLGYDLEGGGGGFVDADTRVDDFGQESIAVTVFVVD